MICKKRKFISSRNSDYFLSIRQIYTMRFVTVLFLITLSCRAQEKTETVEDKIVGYISTFESFQFFNQLNIALEEYAEKRNWLESIPKTSTNVTGFAIGNGFFNGNKSYYDINLFYTSYKTYSSGFSNYGYSSREFRIRNLGLGFDYLITNKYLFNQIYLGGGIKYSRLSFYSLSEFNSNWRVNGNYISLSPKLEYIPKYLKRRLFIGAQINLPLHQINITDLKKEMGTVNTSSYMWPCSFDISIKVCLL